MKPVFLLCLIISLVLVVAFINQEDKVSEKHLELVFRDIGHQLLLLSRDSTSRVLPVKKIKDNNYQISFQNNFLFIPDSLINVVSGELEKYHLPKEYIVTVKDCQQKETIFSYEISSNGNLIPCNGRVQKKGCYLIDVEFLNANKFNYSLLLLLIPLCSVIFFIKIKSQKNQNPNLNNEETNFVQLGRFKFYAEKQMLQFENKNITLSENETKALIIFAENRNQIIEREKLMKEIWEDEGVIVISRNVDVLISKLRKKLSGDNTIKIINIHSKGYKLVIEFI